MQLTERQRVEIAVDPWVMPFIREVLDEAMKHPGAISEKEAGIQKEFQILVINNL